MIRFDASKLHVEFVQLKTVSTAVGGSITVVDEPATAADNKEVLRRVSVPGTVARQFIKSNAKITKYYKPCVTAIVRYDDQVIALERHPLGSQGELESDGVFGKTQWVPKCESRIDELLDQTQHSAWYFDGRYVYQFKTDIQSAVLLGTPLTDRGNFVSIPVSTRDLTLIGHSSYKEQDRVCVAYISETGAYAITPPVWKELDESISTQDEDDVVVRRMFSNRASRFFDFLSTTKHVNVLFALKAGRDVGRLFGYEAVEPLQIPRLMVDLHTVNLPSIPTEVKMTYDAGMPFLHAFAWLLGITHKADSLEQLSVMRDLFRYLCTKGLFNNTMFDSESVLKQGADISTIVTSEYVPYSEKSTNPPVGVLGLSLV